MKHCKIAQKKLFHIFFKLFKSRIVSYTECKLVCTSLQIYQNVSRSLLFCISCCVQQLNNLFFVEEMYAQCLCNTRVVHDVYTGSKEYILGSSIAITLLCTVTVVLYGSQCGYRCQPGSILYWYQYPGTRYTVVAYLAQQSSKF